MRNSQALRRGKGTIRGVVWWHTTRPQSLRPLFGPALAVEALDVPVVVPESSGSFMMTAMTREAMLPMFTMYSRWQPWTPEE